MASAAELLWGCRQQQHRRRDGGEGGDQVIGRAARLGRPFEVMRLVADQQIPAGMQRGIGQGDILGQQVQAAEDALLGLERIGVLCRQRLHTRLIEERNAQIEAAQQLDQPLMQERFGHQDQHPLHAASEQQPMQDQAGFDGLAKPDLIGQQHARMMSVGDLSGDVQLMRDRADAGAEQPARRCRGQPRGLIERLHPQSEPEIAVQTPGAQALLRAAQAQPRIDAGLGQRLFVAGGIAHQVGDEAVVFEQVDHGQVAAFEIAQQLTGGELRAPQRCIVGGIGTTLAGGRKQQGDAAMLDRLDHAEAKLRLGLGEPTLANGKGGDGLGLGHRAARSTVKRTFELSGLLPRFARLRCRNFSMMSSQPLLTLVIAPNALKGSCSASAAAAALAAGARRAAPTAEIRRVPVADGGDGLLEIACASLGAERRALRVTGPVFTKVDAAFAWLPGERTAIIEMALASGLALLAPAERDPGATTTFGTGELMRAALALGAETLIIGLGGSATNDGGIGMASRSAIAFWMRAGSRCSLFGAALARIARIDRTGVDPRLQGTQVEAICDVENPLTGAAGAAATYAPQKGATPRAVAVLDAGLRRLAERLRQDLDCEAEAVQARAPPVAWGPG